jgi:hypothetical protein
MLMMLWYYRDDVATDRRIRCRSHILRKYLDVAAVAGARVRLFHRSQVDLVLDAMGMRY